VWREEVYVAAFTRKLSFLFSEKQLACLAYCLSSFRVRERLSDFFESVVVVNKKLPKLEFNKKARRNFKMFHVFFSSLKIQVVFSTCFCAHVSEVHFDKKLKKHKRGHSCAEKLILQLDFLALARHQLE